MQYTFGIITFLVFTICIFVDLAMNINIFIKRKKTKEEIAYLENLRDWCADTGLNPDIYLEGIDTLRKELKNVKEIKK